jgi:hypothetical protein
MQTQLAVVVLSLRCSFPYVLLYHLVPVRVLSYLPQISRLRADQIN